MPGAASAFDEWQDMACASGELVSRAVRCGSWSCAFEAQGRAWFAFYRYGADKVAFMVSSPEGHTWFGVVPWAYRQPQGKFDMQETIERVVMESWSSGNMGTVEDFGQTIFLFPGNAKAHRLDLDAPGRNIPPMSGWQTYMDLLARLSSGAYADAVGTGEDCRSFCARVANPRVEEGYRLYPFLGERAYIHGAEVASWDDLDEAMLRVLALSCGRPQDVSRGKRREVARLLASLKGITPARGMQRACNILLEGGAAAERLPASQGEWDAFCEITRVREIIEEKTGLDLPHLTDLKRERYEELVQRLSKFGQHGGNSERAASIASTLINPVRQFADLVVVPMAVRWGAIPLKYVNPFGGPERIRMMAEAGLSKRPVLSEREADGFLSLAYRIMAGDKTLAGLSELVLDFYARYALIGNAMSAAVAGSGVRWKPVLPPVVELGEGFTAHCLVTPEELLAEGDPVTGLNHCVAGYYPRCMAGDLAIVSIREHGTPHSTLALIPPFGSSNKWEAGEHMGAGNRYPGDGWEEREEVVLRAAEAFADPHHGLFGCKPGQPYDPLRPRAIRGLAEAFLPLLPREMRDGSGQAVLEAMKRHVPSILERRGRAAEEGAQAGR